MLEQPVLAEPTSVLHLRAPHDEYLAFGLKISMLKSMIVHVAYRLFGVGTESGQGGPLESHALLRSRIPRSPTVMFFFDGS